MENNQNSENVVLQTAAGAIVDKVEESKAQETFNSIKNLIIKSADIVEAYYEEIDNLISLNGKYVAQADIGEGGFEQYRKDTDMSISATSEYVKQKFKKTETIEGESDEYSFSELENRIRKQEGTIRSGWVNTTLHENGVDLGIEVCATDTVGGNETKRFATFTPSGIELYDGSQSTVPVVTISKEKIKITSAEFYSSVKMGKYRLDLSKGIAFKWEGV
jgi:hypothetical protein